RNTGSSAAKELGMEQDSASACSLIATALSQRSFLTKSAQSLALNHPCLVLQRTCLHFRCASARTFNDLHLQPPPRNLDLHCLSRQSGAVNHMPPQTNRRGFPEARIDQELKLLRT